MSSGRDGGIFSCCRIFRDFVSVGCDCDCAFFYKSGSDFGSGDGGYASESDFFCIHSGCDFDSSSCAFHAVYTIQILTSIVI